MTPPAASRFRAFFCLHCLLALTPALPALAAPVDLAGPSGSEAFGTSVKVLPNGNFVVTDPLYDAPGPVADVGAVYLFTSGGALVSTLKGSSAGDKVGSGGVTVLKNGRFVVASPLWNGAASKTGAVTLGNMTSGVSGTVSSANSLTGSNADDQIGSAGVVALTNGNYLVCSPFWDATIAAVNVSNAGALTWCNGTTGRTGAVTAANSLTGGKSGDQIGGSTVRALPNGNYVTANPLWDSSATDVGAVTWGNGTTGTTGVVSQSNSLIGSTFQDYIGLLGVTVLTNGNYVVISPNWDNGAIFNAGAVTWGNGTTGITGLVSSANSLTSGIGSSRTGSSGVIPLTQGNYLTCSANWANDTGAVTWGNGSTGRSGVISSSNSFVGSASGDFMGGFPGGVTALTDGNYVVACPNWTRPGDATTSGTSTGAVTWGDGSTGLTGTASAANSLIGGSSGAGVGSYVTALAGGKFVVVSYGWEDPVEFNFVVNRGAVTFCDNGSACVGVVGANNSLVGEADTVGLGYNYQIGNGGVTALTSGNYVINSPDWGKASFAFPLNVERDCGAVTWVAKTGATGILTSQASAIGGTAYERAASQVTALTNGNYVITASLWDNEAQADAGAVRWCNGSTGATGPMNSSNSLTGSTASDSVGNVTALSDGNYIVRSSTWDNPTGNLVNAGFIAWCSGTGPTVGAVSPANSVVGTVASAGFSMVYDYDAPRRRLIVGRPASNLVTLWTAPGTPVTDLPEISISDPAGKQLVDGSMKKVSLGTVKVGKSGLAKKFTIKNTGTATLSKLTLSKSGQNKAEFTFTPLGKTSLAPGKSATFTVTLKPKKSGPRTAALRIGSNDANENPFDIQLTGTGK